MKTVGEIIDDLYARRTERLALSKRVEELKLEERELQTLIITKLGEAGLDGGKGSTATAAITHTKQASIADWPSFWEYLKATDGQDLIQKRVAIQAVRARWEEGEEVPGLSPIDVVDLSLTKRR